MKVEKFDDVLDNLACGNVKIKYNRWSFSGGHTYGDFDDFDIIEDNKKIALLRINMNHNEIEYNPSFYLRNDDYSQDLLAELNDEDYGNVCDDIYNNYLPRDDREFCVKITGADGQLYFPRDCGDVSREDIMSGKWITFHNTNAVQDAVKNVMQQAEVIEETEKMKNTAGADYVFWQG